MNGRVLVLNSTYEPINVCTMRRAIVLILKGVARAEERHETELHSARAKISAPSVIRLTEYVHIPFERKSLSLERNVDVFGQTDDRRRGYLGARRMQFGFVALLGARDAFQDQDDRPPHRADVDRLIGRVQDEYSAIHRDTS